MKRRITLIRDSNQKMAAIFTLDVNYKSNFIKFNKLKNSGNYDLLFKVVLKDRFTLDVREASSLHFKLIDIINNRLRENPDVLFISGTDFISDLSTYKSTFLLEDDINSIILPKNLLFSDELFTIEVNSYFAYWFNIKIDLSEKIVNEEDVYVLESLLGVNYLWLVNYLRERHKALINEIYQKRPEYRKVLTKKLGVKYINQCL